MIQSSKLYRVSTPKKVKFASYYKGTGDIPTVAPIGVVTNRLRMRVINHFLFWSTTCLVNLSVVFSVPEAFYSSYHLLP